MTDKAAEISRLRARLRISRQTVTQHALDIMELEAAAEQALAALATVEPTAAVLMAKSKLRQALSKGHEK
jgi:hypothetical protein